MPEGIALNDQGDIFLGDRRLLAGGEQRRGDVVRITPDGRVSRYASPRAVRTGFRPLRPDGRPGTPSVAAADPLLQIIDGPAADAHGDLYAAVVGFSIVGTAPVVNSGLFPERRLDAAPGVVRLGVGMPGAAGH